ncbi:Isopentenyl-diphosphate Delta-isomerase [compost metagenome]
MDFRYCETDPSGIVENEICPVYAAKLVGTLTLNPDEVMAVQWVELESLIGAVEATPWAFSPWMVSQVALAQEKLRQFALESKP